MAEDPNQPPYIPGQSIEERRALETPGAKAFDACGADIAKDIRARVSDLNELVRAATRLGLQVAFETVEPMTRTIGEQPWPELKVQVSQPL